MNKRILVVDDDRQIRIALRHILMREGYDVSEAADGYAALRSISAEEETYDLVLMDIIMPDKEGIETIMEIRKKKMPVKIVAMSGGGRMRDYDPLKLARACGANFVIAKPFEPSAIRELIRLCLAA